MISQLSLGCSHVVHQALLYDLCIQTIHSEYPFASHNSFLAHNGLLPVQSDDRRNRKAMFEGSHRATHCPQRRNQLPPAHV
jgi:hypothetical protein